MSTLSRRSLVPILASATALAIACSSSAGSADGTEGPSGLPPTPAVSAQTGDAVSAQAFVIPNVGNGQMEGHTPRGFRGSGTGLFAGDNLNQSFPNGDGVQIFLTFDIADVPRGEVVSATLRSDNFTARGTPFNDLGTLTAAEMRWDRFSPDLWNTEPSPGAATCVFAGSADGPFACDLGDALQNSLDAGYGYAQFRLRFDRISDSDGTADLAAFFLTDSNINEPGIFEFDVELKLER